VEWEVNVDARDERGHVLILRPTATTIRSFMTLIFTELLCSLKGC